MTKSMGKSMHFLLGQTKSKIQNTEKNRYILMENLLVKARQDLQHLCNNTSISNVIIWCDFKCHGMQTVQTKKTKKIYFSKYM